MFHFPDTLVKCNLLLKLWAFAVFQKLSSTLKKNQQHIILEASTRDDSSTSSASASDISLQGRYRNHKV